MGFDSQRRAVRAGMTGWLAGLAVALLVAGCASPRYRAPIEDRPVGARAPVAAPAVSATEMPTPVQAQPAPPAPPGAQNAGKPGYYTVKPGDTLIRVSLETGQNRRDLVKWNQLENENVIEVGQVLRVVPPDTDPTVTATRPVNVAKVETRPLDPVAAKEPAPAAVPAAPDAPAVGPRSPDDTIDWMWPASGPVIRGFDDARSKGLSIAGKAGDPVLAAADGRVVYAGSGLRGYGNLVILKHNNVYLTAYAHNRVLLVKEDQMVRRGQKIAEMGSSDADRVQLHFEIRKQGKPIDPAKLLPPR